MNAELVSAYGADVAEISAKLDLLFKYKLRLAAALESADTSLEMARDELDRIKELYVSAATGDGTRRIYCLAHDEYTNYIPSVVDGRVVTPLVSTVCLSCKNG